jgi:hypothetical protein
VRAEDEGEAFRRLGRPGEAAAGTLPDLTPEARPHLQDLPLLVGQRVAEAAVEPRPGRPERQVSDAEAAALREIAAALRVES